MSTWEIREGDALDRLREMPAESVQCCITSPPYFGLRDYGTGEWEGGDPNCSHTRRVTKQDGLADIPCARGTGGRMVPAGGQKARNAAAEVAYRDTCPCGARRTDQQLGLEATPDAYVARLVEVFREVRRVLRADGTLWLNIGDSYTAGAGSRNGLDGSGLKRNVQDEEQRQRCLTDNKVYRASAVTGISTGTKPKDLLMIPAQLALALRADGWYLRSEIIWAKPNPMPESVTDRPTSAHEKLFLLAKQPRYYFDADAIRESHRSDRAIGEPNMDYSNGSGRLDGGLHVNGAGFGYPTAGRNKRNVWEIATQPYAEAHFACVDERTECLTTDGWKRHDELGVGDSAAQFDMEAGTLSWGPVEAVARYEVTDQEMVVGKRRDLDMVLTPNHRCVIQRRHPSTRRYQAPAVVRADELLPSHAVPSTAPWSQDNPAYAEMARNRIRDDQPLFNWQTEAVQSVPAMFPREGGL